MFSIDKFFLQFKQPLKLPVPVAMIVTPDFVEYMDGFIDKNNIRIGGISIKKLNVKVYVSRNASCICETFYNWTDFDLAIDEINRKAKNYVI